MFRVQVKWEGGPADSTQQKAAGNISVQVPILQVIHLKTENSKAFLQKDVQIEASGPGSYEFSSSFNLTHLQIIPMSTTENPTAASSEPVVFALFSVPAQVLESQQQHTGHASLLTRWKLEPNGHHLHSCFDDILAKTIAHQPSVS